MKISPVNLYSKNLFRQRQNGPFFKSLNHDAFERKTKENHQKTPFGVDNSVLDEMKNMYEDEKENRMSWVVSSTKEIAKESYEVAKLTEEMFDERYGKDNWVFVSIGTSPAGIAKALELRGHDVRYLPISEVRLMFDENFEEYSDLSKHSEYLEYLDFIKLRKDNINNDKRHYVFADLTVRGKTIKYLQEFAYANGFDPEKAHFLSINENLKEFTENNKDEKTRDVSKNYIKKKCITQQVAYYAGIPHIPYYDTNLIKSRFLDSHRKNSSETGFEEALCYYHLLDSKQN